MAMAVVSFRVLGGRDLPKTDTFSATDPFLKGLTSNGAEFETSRKSDTANPTWKERFVLSLPCGPPGGPPLGGWVELTLYDEDPLRNSRVGSCRLDLSSFNSLQAMKYLELPVEVKDKYKRRDGKTSTISVAVEGAVLDYPTLRASLAGLPGVLFDDANRRLYAPLEAGGRLYLGVEYERAEVDFKIYTTSSQPGLYVDLINQGKAHTKLRRRTYAGGRQVVPGLRAFEELKLDDVHVASDFGKVLAVWFDAVLCRQSSAGAVVSAHGWRGALNFPAACSTLHDIHVDHHEEEVGMFINPGETMLLVDWDKDDADIKLAVVPTATTQNKGYDFCITGADVKKTCELFNPPKTKVGGVSVGRIFELDDVPYGTAFNHMAILEFDLSNMRSASVQAVTNIMIQ
mmetsp:Transcript_44122/g.114281  ORF Transcript_44122/g.114281 Transcript_44122/m.114281 type:complete len:401 (-) Transcript_44122:228-1430(-)